MIAELGKFLALLAFVLAVAQGVLGLLGGARASARISATAAASAQTALLACLMSFGLLVALFVQSDFSVSTVTANSHTDKPLIYKIAGTWGNHEGSMLLWCLISALFGAVLASAPGRLPSGLWARAVGVQGLVTAAALAYTLFLSSPFARLDPAPLQGEDLNPLLQDPALALHPPMLYLGYVGMSIPFSLAVAALLEGKVDETWARALRPWTLAAWTCLTVGIGLGSYWAYYELGWGGWWFWDPVENASFMPWLAAAALMHSAIVTERRGNLASWTILLAILAFGLALLGTFLVRSGVLTSVHAFAVDPRRGVAVLAMFLAAVGVGLALFAWRAPSLTKPAGFAAVSKESALVLNNIGLGVATGTVLIGTLYPLLLDATTGQIISVGPPYFNLTFGPLMAVLFVMLPFAPFLAWRKGEIAAALRRLWLVALASAALGLVVIVLAPHVFWAGVGIGLGAWLILGALAYVWKRAGDGGGSRLGRLSALPLALWAMTAAHAGLGVLTIGAVAEVGFRQEATVRLNPGEEVAFAGRTVRLDAVESVEGPNWYGEGARFTATRDGVARAASAERRIYPAAGMPTTEVGLLPNWDGDVYLALGEPVREGPEAGAWTVRLYKKPFVHLIWLGMTLMAVGGALGLAVLVKRRLAAAAEARTVMAQGTAAE